MYENCDITWSPSNWAPGICCRGRCGSTTWRGARRAQGAAGSLPGRPGVRREAARPSVVPVSIRAAACPSLRCVSFLSGRRCVPPFNVCIFFNFCDFDNFCNFCDFDNFCDFCNFCNFCCGVSAISAMYCIIGEQVSHAMCRCMMQGPGRVLRIWCRCMK